MTNKILDIEKILKELEALLKKYDLPKMFAFVPNKLEISLERKGINEFSLVYKEFFDYLPNTIRKLATESTIQFLKMLGITRDITRLENGVMTHMSGDFLVAYLPIIEILIQNKYYETTMESFFNVINKRIQKYSNFFIFNWEYNKETEQQYHKCLERVRAIFEKNPSIQSEIENIYKKNTKIIL